jgi:hypothetical protein
VELAEKSYASRRRYKKGSSDLQSLKAARDTLERGAPRRHAGNYSLANSILELENELNLPFGQLGRD